MRFGGAAEMATVRSSHDSLFHTVFASTLEILMLDLCETDLRECSLETVT